MSWLLFSPPSSSRLPIFFLHNFFLCVCCLNKMLSLTTAIQFWTHNTAAAVVTKTSIPKTSNKNHEHLVINSYEYSQRWEEEMFLKRRKNWEREEKRKIKMSLQENPPYSHGMEAARANSSYSCFLSVLHFDGVVLFGHFFFRIVCELCVLRATRTHIFYAPILLWRMRIFRTRHRSSRISQCGGFTHNQWSLCRSQLPIIRPKCEEKSENNRSQDRRNIVGRV